MILASWLDQELEFIPRTVFFGTKSLIQERFPQKCILHHLHEGLSWSKRASQRNGRWIDRSIDRLTDWQTNKQIAWLIDWLLWAPPLQCSWYGSYLPHCEERILDKIGLEHVCWKNLIEAKEMISCIVWFQKKGDARRGKIDKYIEQKSSPPPQQERGFTQTNSHSTAKWYHMYDVRHDAIQCDTVVNRQPKI